MKKVLAFKSLTQTEIKRIQDLDTKVNLTVVDNQDTCMNEIVDADAFIGVITPELLAAGKQLQWVQAMSAGLERYVFPELVQSNVTLTNLRCIYNDQGADHAFALILGLAKRLPRALKQQFEGVWDSTDYNRIDLAGKTLGIIGLGGIGYALAQRGHLSGMNIIAVDPRREDCPSEVSRLLRPEALGEMLQSADFVACCAPHTPDTERLMNIDRFSQMKPSAFFVNIGRGAVVVLDDLVTALEQGLIEGAALDVYETEPLPQGHPLWKQPNVILTPHVAAGGTEVTARRREEVFVKNVERFASEKPLENVVDKMKWF
ncbi:MAG: D-2-hydroxyacid dehydrogenase [Planctomycetota bacterium]|nr:D-2-hydroxyacid dehydrogenase [Planctomycetota bacterium]MDA1139797.1 D-2-hydroxyacid dehydrogenase [Planctomycetota bacterium]